MTEQLTPDPGAPEPVESPSPTPEVVPMGPADAEDPEAQKRRRRKAALLLFLASLAGLFLLFTGWYLIFRKPITELPLPAIVEETLPHYAFSIYGIDRPIGITASPSGDRIYVAETAGDRALLVYDSKGDRIAQAVPPKSTAGSRSPVYVAVDPLTGDVYVSDRTSAAIYVYDKDGAYRRQFQPKPPLPTWAPLGLTFDAQGNLYVGDVSEPQRIEVFGRDGSLLRSLGQPGELSFPNGLAVDAKGNLFIADGNNGRLVVMDPNGSTIAVIPRGVGNGELGLPRGTALDDTGRLFVVDTTGQSIQIYRLDETTSRPKYIGTAGSEGRGDGQFEYPFGVATDARARIYVADWANDRVQVWSY